MMDFTGKVALVTGGSTGIGHALLRPDQLRTLDAIGAHVAGIASASNPGGDLVVEVDSKYTAFLDAHCAAEMVMRPDFYLFGGVAEAHGVVALVDELIAALATAAVRVPAEAAAGQGDRQGGWGEPGRRTAQAS